MTELNKIIDNATKAQTEFLKNITSKEIREPLQKVVDFNTTVAKQTYGFAESFFNDLTDYYKNLYAASTFSK